MKKTLLAALVAICALRASAVEAQNHKLVWYGTTASWQQLGEKNGIFSKTVGNAMLPMFLMGMAQKKLSQMFGEMRTSEPLRWAAFDVPEEEDELEVVLLYPSVDKEAMMVFNHPGAKKVEKSPRTVVLPKGEGRDSAVVAVFSADGRYCAISRKLRLARAALKLTYPASDDDTVCAFVAGEGAAAVRVNGEFLDVTVNAPDPADHAALEAVPVAGKLFTENGTRRLSAGGIVTECLMSLGKATN